MNTPDMETIFAAIPKSDLPEPGTSTMITMSNGMIAELHSVRRGRTLERRPRSLRYVAVTTGAEHAEVIHAGINRRVNTRNRLSRFTLCDRNGDRVADKRVDGSLDDLVTCKQCRAHLVEDGMLDQV